MHPQPGYYSLVQFCPDPSRLEAVNVGVLLFCPASDFVQVKLIDGNDRVKKVFGKEAFHPRALDAAKRGLVYRLEKTDDRPRSKEDLERFVGARADNVRLSEPRSLVVDEPQQELEALFQKLVIEPARPRARRRPPLVPELEALFRNLKRDKRARLNVSVEVPVLEKRINVPYVYENGLINYVKPYYFPAKESSAENAAMVLAVEGDLLAKHLTADGRDQKLVVVTTFAPTDRNDRLRQRVFGVLEEYHVQAVRPENVTEYIEQVQREAH